MPTPEPQTRAPVAAVLIGVAVAAGLALATYAGFGIRSRPADSSVAAVAAPASDAAAAPRYRQAATLGGGKIWRSQVTFADFDQDGLVDLGVVSRLADGPWVFRNQGNGEFRPADSHLPRQTFCGGGMDFADLDKDGKIDVAIADHCQGASIYLGDGKGNWRHTTADLPSIGVEDVALGDFDNDGCVDLVAGAAAEEGLVAMRGNCKGEWTRSADGLPPDEWANTVELADVNGDGHLDVAATHAAGPRVWLGDGRGAWRAASVGLPQPQVHGLYWGIALGDLNGDGRLDLATTSQMAPKDPECGAPGKAACTDGGLQVFVQQADGSWKESNQGVAPITALGVAIGDLDNDGDNDVVAAGKRAIHKLGGVFGVFPYLNDGAANWSAAPDTGLPATGLPRAWGVGLADVDRDGRLDVGVALGDVVAPTRRKDPRTGKETGSQPRGHFGEIQIWLATAK